MFLEFKKRFGEIQCALIRVSISDNASPITICLSANVMIKRALSPTVIAAPGYKGLKSALSSFSFSFRVKCSKLGPSNVSPLITSSV